MNEIVKINPADYGLEESKAKQISEMFKPMLDKMVELEDEFNEVSQLKISKETCEKAHDLRQKYVKVRTGTAAIHKELKAFYLQGGRFVDGWKNAQIMASQGIEDKLTSIEKHYENLELERLRKLTEVREKELSKYLESEYIIPVGLGVMTEEVWNNYLTGAKTNFEARKEAERKAEEERIAKEKAEAEERERIRVENIRLKKEAEEREKREKEESIKRQKAEELRLQKEAEERKIREEKERKEHEEREKAEEKFQKKIDAERKERERAQEELRVKCEADQRAEIEKQEMIQAELSKNDADKVVDLISSLNELKTKYSFKSKKNQGMYHQVGLLVDKAINYINSF